MDAFDDAFGAPVEVDPAAEFLAKEQEELADLGEDLGFAAPPQQDILAFKSDEPMTNGHETFDFFTDHDQTDGSLLAEDPAGMVSPPAGVTNVDFFQTEGSLTPGTSADMFDGNEDSVIQVASSTATPFNPFAAPQAQQAEPGLSRGMQSMRIREEPECIKKWKVEQEERLRLKDEEEKQKMEELRAKAKKELDDWYKRYEDQLVKTKTNNRSAQEEFVAEINNIMPGSEWERVAKHCDFNPKSTRHSKDVSRMRALLLQLKQNPPASRS